MRNFSRDALRTWLQRRYDTSGLSDLQRFYGEQMAYGHREVLLEYLNLPKDKFFKAIITHGKILPDEIDPILPSFDNFGQQIMQVLWRSDARTQAAKKGVNAISIGATGIYAMLNRGHSLEQIIRNVSYVSANHKWSQDENKMLDILSDRKILYMPVHSWDGDVIKRSKNDVEFLKNLNPKNIVVCLGYLDFIDPECRSIYVSAGFAIECAGVRASKVFGSPAGGREKFLENLISLIEPSDFVLADELTTGLLYAACLGKQIGILTIPNRSELAYSKWRNSDAFKDEMTNQREYFKWLTGTQTDQKTINMDITMSLGLDRIKAPEQLFDLIPIL